MRLKKFTYFFVLLWWTTMTIIITSCFGQEAAPALQPITALHSIVARQAVYEANANGQLTATCDVCEQTGANVSVYWGRDDSVSGVPAFVIGGKIKYPRWTTRPAEKVSESCGPDNKGARYVVTLEADSLTVADSGRWWCQLLPNNNSADWRFAYFTINVYGSLSASNDVTLRANDTVLPVTQPSSSQPPSITVVEGSTTNMACELNPVRLNKHQNATVNWQIEGQSTFLAEDTATFDYVASIDHFGKTITCSVDYFAAPPQGKAPTVTRRIVLNVILRPRTSISAWGPAGMTVSADAGNVEASSTSGPRSLLIDEGQPIELHCSPFNNLLHNSRALTGKEHYRWFVVEPSTGTTSELTRYAGKRVITMGPLDRNGDGTIVRCDVDNGYFLASAQLQFSVQYKLAANAEATFIGATVGDTVSLDCTTGDTEADRFIASYQFTWFFGRLQILVGDNKQNGDENAAVKNVGQILSFRLGNSSQFGSYRCLARNARSGSQAARNFFILEKSKPQASASLAVVDAVPRYSASIRCSTFGLPRPSLFRWFRQNMSEPSNELFDDNIKFEIVERNASSAVTESTLVIREVVDDDFGRYVCVATNDFGSVESAFLLAKKESFPTVEIIAGACAGSFILAVLVAVAIYFKCRRIKGNDSGANSLKLSETASSGSGGHDASSSSSASSDRDRRRDSITSPTYTVDVVDKSSASPPGVATIGSHHHHPIHPQHPHHPHHIIHQQQPQTPKGTSGAGNYAMSHAITLPSMPNMMPSYHRYPDAMMDVLPTVVSGNQNNGLVRLSTSVNDNFDDWLKQSRLATFSHLGAYQPSVSFRHPLPPIPVSSNISTPATPAASTVGAEQSRLATDV